MTMEMYSVYDRKLREYGSVVLAPNVAVVSRTIVTGVRGSKSLMELYPEDFELHRVGSFNIQTGEVASDGRPAVVCSLQQLLEVGNAEG